MPTLTLMTAPKAARTLTRHFAAALGGNFLIVTGETNSPTTTALFLRRIDATPDQWPGLWLGVMPDHAEYELEEHINDLDGWWESMCPVVDEEAAKRQAVHTAFTTYHEWWADHREVHKYADDNPTLANVVYRLWLGRGSWIPFEEVAAIMARDFSLVDASA